MLDDNFLVTKRVQLRALHLGETRGFRAATGPFYRMARVGMMNYLLRKFAGCAARSHSPQNPAFGWATAGLAEAILKLCSHNRPATVIRGQWPVCIAAWQAANQDSLWSVGETAWDFEQLFMLLKMWRQQLHLLRDKFDRTQALTPYPSIFASPATTVARRLHVSPPPSPRDSVIWTARENGQT